MIKKAVRKEIRQLLSNFDLQNLLIHEKYFIVNLDWFANREYQNQGINELLYLAGCNKNKIFVFLVIDGINCNLSGLDNVVRQIVKNFNLSEATCVFYGYSNLGIQNATFIRLDQIGSWCTLIHGEIKNYAISPGNFEKLFCVMIGRHDMFRLMIVKHIYNNYKHNSIIGYASKFSHSDSELYQQFFSEDLQWFKNNCPIQLDFIDALGHINWRHSLQKLHDHYQKYFIEIVCETDPHSNMFFTEKTLKNFYLGKPFILLAGKDSLKYLQSKNFKTFAPYINESYDDIECISSRLTAIINEIDRLAKLPKNELEKIYVNLHDIFEHNRQNFQKYVLTS